MQVSTLSCSLHLKRIRRQARRLHNAHTRATLSSCSTLGNKRRFCPPHGEVIRSMERGGRTGLSCQTASASNQIVLHCCVKFQMTSKDVFFLFLMTKGGHFDRSTIKVFTSFSRDRSGEKDNKRPCKENLPSTFLTLVKVNASSCTHGHRLCLHHQPLLRLGTYMLSSKFISHQNNQVLSKKSGPMSKQAPTIYYG